MLLCTNDCELTSTMIILLLELVLCDCSYSATGGGKRQSFLGSLFHRSKERGSTPDAPTPDTPTLEAMPAKSEEKTVKVKRSNSNALVLQLGSLAREPTPIVGDPCFCHQCGAAISHISQLTTQAETTSWKWLVLMCCTRSIYARCKRVSHASGCQVCGVTVVYSGL